VVKSLRAAQYYILFSMSRTYFLNSLGVYAFVIRILPCFTLSTDPILETTNYNISLTTKRFSWNMSLACSSVSGPTRIAVHWGAVPDVSIGDIASPVFTQRSLHKRRGIVMVRRDAVPDVPEDAKPDPLRRS
jgi:hypothetical protein